MLLETSNMMTAEEVMVKPSYWLFNLVTDVFGDPNMWMKVYIPAVFEAIGTLTEREQEIVIMRYMKDMTLASIGELYGINRERVRQIIAKAFRKLRHPSRSKRMIAISREEYNEVVNKVCTLQAENLSLHYPEHSLDTINIETLDLSVRAYNCIKRAGYERVTDFFGKSIEDLMTVRNLGRICLQEVIDKLEKLNIRPDKDGNNFQLRDENGLVVA